VPKAETISISKGLPSGLDDWPPEVLQACADIRSGDVVPDPPFFYYANPRYAVWRATHDYTADSDGPEIVDAYEYRPPYGVITSQTCDIGEVGFRPPVRPWVMLAPVFDMSDLSSPIKKAIVSDRHSKFLIHLPAIPAPQGEFWVADLRIEMPVEKSALVGVDTFRSFDDDRQQNSIGQRVADLRSRPAWAESMGEITRRLTQYLTETRSVDRDLWEAVRREFRELGARVDSLDSPTTVQLCAFTSAPVGGPAREWWMGFYDQLCQDPPSGLVIQQSVVENLGICSVLLYREFAPIPFREFGID
jgi:hypothetical protein